LWSKKKINGESMGNTNTKCQGFKVEKEELREATARWVYWAQPTDSLCSNELTLLRLKKFSKSYYDEK